MGNYKKFDAYGSKNMKTWLNDDKRPKGCNAKNVEYLRELKSILPEFSRVGVLTYFLVTRLGVQDARTMMSSARKQKDLIVAVILDLKRYAVTKDYEPAFERNFRSLRKRCDYVYAICKADLTLTKHWPYFSGVGFEKLLDFDIRYTGKDTSVLDWLIPDMEQWEVEHTDEINAHLESIRPELEAKAKHQEEVKAKEKAEKEAIKAKKRAENAEVREIRENARKEAVRKRKIERELETTIRMVGRTKND